MNLAWEYVELSTENRIKYRSQRTAQELDLIPPEIIHAGNKQYKRGPFLAKVSKKLCRHSFSVNSIYYNSICVSWNFQGGFAKCYELTDMDTKKTYAGKIMSIKHIRSAPALWKAFLNETNIHRELKHINIVCLHACFLDQKFSYFVLELCRKEVLFHLIYILSNHNTFFMFLFKCRH